MDMKRFLLLFCLVVSSSINNILAEDNFVSRMKYYEKQSKYSDVLEICYNNKNEPYAIFIVGDYFYHGRKGVPINKAQGYLYYQQAISPLTQLAQNNDNIAQYFLGRCYEYGKSDWKTAREWYIKAADNGNSDAMVKAAMFIAKRKGGGKKEPARVMAYIQKAIRSGNPDGKALLASFYLEGRKDIEKGIKLAKEASDAGSPLGQMILGSLYLQGIGSISKYEQKAIELFQLSSDQGNSMINDFLRQKKSKDKFKL